MRRAANLFAIALVALGLAACDGDDDDERAVGGRTTAVRVYFLRGGKIWPVLRRVPAREPLAAAATRELVKGPTAHESAVLGASTDWPSDPEQEAMRGPGLAQLVYTLTQFPDADAIEIDGRTVTRKDMEDWTPAILVESPLPFQTVRGALRVEGTANTFEANFEYELRDAAGRVLADHFVTATSGTGTRGTFGFSVAFAYKGRGTLVVFERSAKDGSRINEVEIPLRLEP